MIPQFAVFYSPVSNVVTMIVTIEIGNDSEDNVRKGLMSHRRPGEAVVFIPKHQAEDTELILGELGIRMNAVPLQN